MSLCECAFGPRCESIRCCVDEQATVGAKDVRTGEIRSRADWSVVREPRRKFHRLHAAFYCNDCWELEQEADRTPIPGIDKPEHASDFWRPSIMAMIDHAMRAERERKRKLLPPVYYTSGDQPITTREKQLSPAQWKQIVNLRKMMREMHA